MLGTVTIGAAAACLAMIYWFTTSDVGAIDDSWPTTLLERDAFAPIAEGIKLEATMSASETSLWH